MQALLRLVHGRTHARASCRNTRQNTTPALLSIALLLASTLGAAAARAQTLAQALEQAWALHPQAQAGAARQAEAAARTEAAAGLTPGPASLSLASVNDRFQANQGQREWEVEVAAPLWLPGQQAAQAAAAASNQDGVAAQQNALHLQLAGEVRSAWWAVAAARQARDLAQRRQDTAQALQADVQRRFKAGELARIDANLARSESLAAQSALAEADTALLQAGQAYRALTGTAPPAQPMPEPPTTQDAAAPDHPLLAVAAAAVAQAQARLQLADRSHRAAPELALRMVRERGAAGQPYASTLGIKLTIPLSSGPQVRQASAAALAALAQAQAGQEAAQRRLILDIDQARRDLQSTQRLLALAQERLALETDTLQLAEKSFALGETGLAALLRARAAALEAEALAGQHQVARAAAQSRWHQSLGVLP